MSLGRSLRKQGLVASRRRANRWLGLRHRNRKEVLGPATHAPLAAHPSHFRKPGGGSDDSGGGDGGDSLCLSTHPSGGSAHTSLSTARIGTGAGHARSLAMPAPGTMDRCSFCQWGVRLREARGACVSRGLGSGRVWDGCVWAPSSFEAAARAGWARTGSWNLGCRLPLSAWRGGCHKCICACAVRLWRALSSSCNDSSRETVRGWALSRRRLLDHTTIISLGEVIVRNSRESGLLSLVKIKYKGRELNVLS